MDRTKIIPGRHRNKAWTIANKGKMKPKQTKKTVFTLLQILGYKHEERE